MPCCKKPLDKHLFPLAIAQDAAYLIRQEMQAYCVRLEVAGSVRRCLDRIPVITLVAIPMVKSDADLSDLFGDRKIEVNHLYEKWAMKTTKVQWMDAPPSRPDRTMKYSDWQWRGTLTRELTELHSVGNVECVLDIDLTDKKRWGTRKALSTGSEEFITEIGVHAGRVGYVLDKGALWKKQGFGSNAGLDFVETPEEEDFFRELGLRCPKPNRRRTAADVVSLPPSDFPANYEARDRMFNRREEKP